MHEYPMDYNGDGEIGADDMTIWNMYEDSERIRAERDDELAAGGSPSGGGSTRSAPSSDRKQIYMSNKDMDKLRRAAEAKEYLTKAGRIYAVVMIIYIIVKLMGKLIQGRKYLGRG